MLAHKVTYIERRPGKAECPPNPDYPNGMDVEVISASMTDEERARAPHCKIELPYPAAGVGYLLIECDGCGRNALLSTAGRVDDPRTIRLPCGPRRPRLLQ